MEGVLTGREGFCMEALGLYFEGAQGLIAFLDDSLG
jgi:hypothetical protein